MTQDIKSIAPQDAITLICICAMQADMKIKPNELKKLASMIELSPLYQNIEDPIEYITQLNDKFSAVNIDTVIDNAIERLSPQLRETAYAWACEIVTADRGISQEEHSCLSALVKKMGLHGEFAGKIAAVIAILNRKK